MSRTQKFWNPNKGLKRVKKGKKIILNTAQDLLNIPNEEFEKIDISNLEGEYYNQLYLEAVELERKMSEILNKKSIKVSNIHKTKLNKNNDMNEKSKVKPFKNIIKKIQKEKIMQKSKSRSNSKDKNLQIRKPNYKYIINNLKKNSDDANNSKKHIFSPEMPSKINPFEYKQVKPKKYIKKANQNNDNTHKYHLYTPSSRKIEVNLYSTFNKTKEVEKEKKVNKTEMQEKNINENIPIINYTKFPSDEIKKNNNNIQNNNQNINQNNIQNNIKNNNYNKNNYNKNNNNYKRNNNDNQNNLNYNQSNNCNQNDNIKNTKKINSLLKDCKYQIDRIIFYIRYDSNYGDNIGILGSIEPLGNWSEDKILYLKWNKGNIWKGEIDLNDLDTNKFEFKFINRSDGIIYWEKGYNNVFDLKSIIEELNYHKKGRYNKYEYNYDNRNCDLILTCKIKGWE